MRDAGSISIPTKLLATGVACALAVVVCGTAASVLVASDATGKLRKVSDTRREVASQFGPGESFRDRGPTAALIDSLLEPLGVRTRASALDVAILNSLSNRGRSKSPVWDVTSLALSPGPLPRGDQRRAGLTSVVATSLDAQWIATALQNAGSPWMPLFRRWARSTPMPSLWGYREGLPGVRDARALPKRSITLMSTLFRANEESGVLAMQSGAYPLARERALENISASRHFIEQPIIYDALVGRMWFRRGLQLLTLAAGHQGDSGTIALANRLETAASKFDIGPLHLTADLEDASSRAAEDAIGDQSLHPAFRIEALGSIILGGCRNTSEVVLGFKGSRRESLERAVQFVSDIPRGPELAQQYLRLFDYAMSNGHAEVHPPRQTMLDRSEVLQLFSWIVPPGVRARASLCLEQG